MTQQFLILMGLIALGAFIYYGPDWLGLKKSMITLNGVNYHIERDGDRKVIVKFNVDGVDFIYRKEFPEMALRDMWIEKFGPLAVTLIMHAVTGELVFRGVPIPELEEGKALVIMGAKASGKGILAKTIIDIHGLTSCHMSSTAISRRSNIPEVGILVLDYFHTNLKILNELKLLVTSHTMQYRPKGKPSYLARPPKLIILSDPEYADIFKDTRYFTVVHI